MNLQTLKTKVEEISKSKNVPEGAIYDKLVSVLDTVYNYVVPAPKEQEIIDTIKYKIRNKIYKNNNNLSLPVVQGEMSELYGLDKLELEYFARAVKELEADGQVNLINNTISLTDKGIFAAKDK